MALWLVFVVTPGRSGIMVEVGARVVGGDCPARLVGGEVESDGDTVGILQ